MLDLSGRHPHHVSVVGAITCSYDDVCCVLYVWECVAGLRAQSFNRATVGFERTPCLKFGQSVYMYVYMSTCRTACDSTERSIN